MRVQLLRRSFVFVNCHLAAHQHAVRKRNADVEIILSNLLFEPALSEHWRAQQKLLLASEPPPPPPKSAPSKRFSSAENDDSGDDDPAEDDSSAPQASRPARAAPPAGGCGDADLFLFIGDTNYRLDGVSHDEAVAAVARGELGALARQDQCLRERMAGRLLPGMSEGALRFPPTYKFDKGVQGPLAYDSSEKKRVPAWCDRIFFSDGAPDGGVKAELEAYDSVMDVCESDHKPVRAVLRVSFPAMDERKRRRAVAAAAAEGGGVPPPPEELLIEL